MRKKDTPRHQRDGHRDRAKEKEGERGGAGGKGGYSTDRLHFASPGPFERVELSNDFARGWQLMPLDYPLPVTGYPVTSNSPHSPSLLVPLPANPYKVREKRLKSATTMRFTVRHA